MKFSSLGYCIAQGFKSIGRNRIFSIASIATMALCIFILGVFYSVTANVNYMVDKMSDALCVKVFFDEGISDERIESIGNTIKEYEGVVVIHYTSAEEAWEEYNAQILLDARKKARLTQQDLAARIGADNGYNIPC